MPSGGKRKGAGRKPGAKVLRTAWLAKVELAKGEGKDGITPIQVILRTMRALWAEAESVDENGIAKINIEKAKEASAVAAVAAPYVHPRLNSIEGVQDKPLIIDTSDNMLEAARRLAFTITMGAREAAKQIIEKKAKAKADL